LAPQQQNVQSYLHSIVKRSWQSAMPLLPPAALGFRFGPGDDVKAKATEAIQTALNAASRFESA
jgi:hypothetical protein